jgi:hypothetical protein
MKQKEETVDLVTREQNNNMERIFYLLNKQGVHDYTVKITELEKGVEFSLYASEGEQWVSLARGIKLMSIVDTENGVELDKSYKELDYSEMEYLRILLNLNNSLRGELKSTYTVCEKSSKIVI